MDDFPNFTPIIGPILSLLRSRKFMAAFMTLVADIIVAYVPALEPARVELLVVLTIVGSTLVAAIAYEDGQRARTE
jgi:hypothetical protein